MAYRIEFSDQAKAQTDSAYLYLSQRSPEAAIRWLNGLDAALASLAESLETLPGRRSFAQKTGCCLTLSFIN